MHCKSKRSIVDARAQGWKVADDQGRAKWRRSSNESVRREEGARQQASQLQGGGAMWVGRGGGGVSASLLLCVEVQLSSRLTLVVVVGSRWSLFLGRGGATRYPEIRRTWQREGRLEGGRPGSSSSNSAQR